MSNINAFCDTISAAAILNREERRAALQDVDNLPGFNRAVLLFAGTGEISNIPGTTHTEVRFVNLYTQYGGVLAIEIIDCNDAYRTQL